MSGNELNVTNHYVTRTNQTLCNECQKCEETGKDLTCVIDLDKNDDPCMDHQGDTGFCIDGFCSPAFQIVDQVFNQSGWKQTDPMDNKIDVTVIGIARMFEPWHLVDNPQMLVVSSPEFPVVGTGAFWITGDSDCQGGEGVYFCTQYWRVKFTVQKICNGPGRYAIQFLGKNRLLIHKDPETYWYDIVLDQKNWFFCANDCVTRINQPTCNKCQKCEGIGENATCVIDPDKNDDPCMGHQASTGSCIDGFCSPAFQILDIIIVQFGLLRHGGPNDNKVEVILGGVARMFEPWHLVDNLQMLVNSSTEFPVFGPGNFRITDEWDCQGGEGVYYCTQDWTVKFTVQKICNATSRYALQLFGKNRLLMHTDPETSWYEVELKHTAVCHCEDPYGEPGSIQKRHNKYLNPDSASEQCLITQRRMCTGGSWTEWDPPYTYTNCTVTYDDCCDKIYISGFPAGIQYTRDGLFSKVDGAISEHLPVYQNADGRYLYYWGPYSDWRIGLDYGTSVAGVRSMSNKFVCPTDTIGWSLYYNGTWHSANINVACLTGNCVGYLNYEALPENWCDQISQRAMCGIGDGIISGRDFDCEFSTEKGHCKRYNSFHQCNKFLEETHEDANCVGYLNYDALPANWCDQISQGAMCGISDGIIGGRGFDCEFSKGKGYCKRDNSGHECNKFLVPVESNIVENISDGDTSVLPEVYYVYIIFCSASCFFCICLCAIFRLNDPDYQTFQEEGDNEAQISDLIEEVSDGRSPPIEMKELAPYEQIVSKSEESLEIWENNEIEPGGVKSSSHQRNKIPYLKRIQPEKAVSELETEVIATISVNDFTNSNGNVDNNKGEGLPKSPKSNLSTGCGYE